jgi:hypothetical protein
MRDLETGRASGYPEMNAARQMPFRAAAEEDYRP